MFDRARLPIAAAMAMLTGGHTALAKPALDPAFTSHAVLQRDRTVPVTGTATPGAEITVTFDATAKVAAAGSDGRWRVDLPAHGPSGPFELTVSGDGGRIVLDDVLVGDVWLCSGQSNMEFALRHATNADAEISRANRPNLRLFTIPRQSSPAALATFSGPASWQVSSPASAADFSAACYLMGSDLQAHQNLPVGLINASWGGSIIEDWIDRDALRALPRYRRGLDLLDLYARDPAAAKFAWASETEKWLGRRAVPPTDASWRNTPARKSWEAWGDPSLVYFDGIGYYRTHVTLTKAQLGKARLMIGAVDDIDLTRVNGQTVGASESWDEPRTYAVPAGLLKAGDNVIDVVAIDTGGGGGMWGDAARGLSLANGSTVPLLDWRFARGAGLAETGVPMGLPWLGGSGLTTLSNGMILPLGHFPLKGIAWYQGESNVADPDAYAMLMPALIASWRERFGLRPFLMVQLAGFGPLAIKPSDNPWARLRDVQRKVADADPQIGLASALDAGQVGDIHPTNKQDVAKRLALAARHIALGEDVEDRGPAPTGVSRTDEGIVVRFAHGPLELVGGGEALGFELCDAHAACRFVPGRLEGDTIILPADPEAREVRYLWQASPLVNLYNQAGLPATGLAMPIE